MADEGAKTELTRLALQRADVATLLDGDEALAAAPVFAALEEAGLAAEVRKVDAYRVPAGTAIVTEGEAGRSLFLVLAGEVRIRVGRGKELVEIATAAKGEFFGEWELLRGGPRRFSAVAGSGTAVAEVPHELLGTPAARSFELRRVLEQALAAREQARRDLDDFLSRW